MLTYFTSEAVLFLRRGGGVCGFFGLRLSVLLTCMLLRGKYKGDRMNSEEIRIRHAI